MRTYKTLYAINDFHSFSFLVDNKMRHRIQYGTGIVVGRMDNRDRNKN